MKKKIKRKKMKKKMKRKKMKKKMKLKKRILSIVVTVSKYFSSQKNFSA